MHRIVALLFVVACSSGDPPVVEGVKLGPFSMDANGNASAHGTVVVDAPSGPPITQLALRFDPETQNGVAFWEGPPLDVTGLSSPYRVTLAFRPDTLAGTYFVKVTATDESGATSEPLLVEVVLPVLPQK